MLILLSSFLTAFVNAQVPDGLIHSILPPFGIPQSGARFGSSVATDGDFVVVGVPLEDLAYREYGGVVKIFHATTGALVHVLSDPDSIGTDFGGVLGISGTRVAVLARNGILLYDLKLGTAPIGLLHLPNATPWWLPRFIHPLAISGTRLVVGTDQDVYIYDISTTNPYTPSEPILRLVNRGGPVSLSGSSLVVGSPTGGPEGVYLYDLAGTTPSIPALTLIDPSPAENDSFGHSVSISGSHIAVGSPNHDTGVADVGRVYVFDLTSSTPTAPKVTVNSPAVTAGSRFGSGVALSGSRLLVGSELEVAWVYDLTGATPTEPAVTLANPGPTTHASFGASLALAGTRVVVGAPDDDTGAVDAGSAYVYELTGTTPAVPATTLVNRTPMLSDYFGTSVALSGRLLVVGASHEDTGAKDAGSAYVYDLESTTPTLPMITLHNPTPTEGEYFGLAVAVSGSRIVIGSPGDSAGGILTGSAYVYDLTSPSPAEPTHTLANPSTAGGTGFGRAVAISGNRVVIGAAEDDTIAENAGSAYVYDLGSERPTVPSITLHPPDISVSKFGIAVAISATRVVVGVPYYDRAYVYDLAGAIPTAPVVTLNGPDPTLYELYGWYLDISDRFVVVLSPGWETVQGTSQAIVAVYDLESASPAIPFAQIGHPRSARFAGVAISGTRLVVGSVESGFHKVRAYIYDLNSASPTLPESTLFKTRPAPNDAWVDCVDISGSSVVLGVPHDDAIAIDKGAAYVFGPNPRDLDHDGLLDSWELTYWPTTAGHGPSDDSDHDGFSELLELAFGLNPTVPDAAGLPAVAIEHGFLTLTIAKHPGVIYEVESAEEALLPPLSFGPAELTVLIDTATTLKVRDETLSGTRPNRFLRVKVTAAP